MSRSDDLCTDCGRLKSMPLAPAPDYSDRDSGKSQEFFTMGKNLFYRYIFIPLGLLIGITAMLIFLPIHGDFQVALICAAVILLIYTVLTAVSISKCYVEVYKNCLEGRIPAKIPCFTKRFTVYYEDIIKVKVYGVGMSGSTTRNSSDSHPRFTLVTKFGAIRIKGLTDSQAAEIHAYLRAYRGK